MKISKLLGAVAVAAVIFTSCASNGSGQKPVFSTNRPEIIDYPGITLGSEIPDWVKAVDEGNRSKIAKSLDLSKDEVFVIINKGDNLDFLKTWSDQVDVEVEVAAQFKRVVGQVLNSEMKGSSTAEGTSVYKSIEMYSSALKNVVLTGLRKEASYWIKYQILKTGVKKATSANDYEVYYTYYVVYAMDKTLYDTQMTAAISGVEDNTSEAGKLKVALTNELLKNILVTDEE